MEFEKILTHYNNPLVQSEIAYFCKEKWIGLHCEALDNKKRKILIRYLNSKKPIQIAKPIDVKNLILKFSILKPRTIYATANIYNQLNECKDVFNYSNIKACTPTWDIDNALDKWNATLQAVLEVVSMLEANGVEKSFFVKFSGRGAHIHIHPYAISEEIRMKYNPLSLAWSIVEYVREKLAEKIVEICLKHKAESLRLDNEIDVQRLFVAPLSIHREVPKVSVCLNPNKLESFNPNEDASLNRFKHFEGWKNYVVGEADELALKAYAHIGGYPYLNKSRKRKHPPLDKQVLRLMQVNE